MIVPSMTHEEVFRELAQDRDNVARWYGHRSREYRRKALKARAFPITWTADYLSPRKNRYIICTQCTRRDYIRYHALTAVALRKEEKGYSVYLTYIGSNTLIKPTVLLPHVFDRYAERAGVNKTGTELIGHFVSKVSGGTILDDEHLAGRSVRYKGRDHMFIAISEGVLLGDKEHGIFTARTFITYDMATGLQREQFEEAKGKLFSVEDEIRYVRQI